MRGANTGHPGHRPTPARIDRREEHTRSRCPKRLGPVRPCRCSRTRVIEDIPADITSAVTEYTIPCYCCPQCRQTVEPAVADASSGSTLGPRVLVFSAWPHYLLGATPARIMEVFSFQLQFKLSAGGLVSMCRRLRAIFFASIFFAWHLEIQAQALDGAVHHADETGWRVNGKTHCLWCFTSTDFTCYTIDRSRGSPAL